MPDRKTAAEPHPRGPVQLPDQRAHLFRIDRRRGFGDGPLPQQMRQYGATRQRSTPGIGRIEALVASGGSRRRCRSRDMFQQRPVRPARIARERGGDQAGVQPHPMPDVSPEPFRHADPLPGRAWQQNGDAVFLRQRPEHRLMMRRLSAISAKRMRTRASTSPDCRSCGVNGNGPWPAAGQQPRVEPTPGRAPDDPARARTPPPAPDRRARRRSPGPRGSGFRHTRPAARGRRRDPGQRARKSFRTARRDVRDQTARHHAIHHQAVPERDGGRRATDAHAVRRQRASRRAKPASLQIAPISPRWLLIRSSSAITQRSACARGGALVCVAASTARAKAMEWATVESPDRRATKRAADAGRLAAHQCRDGLCACIRAWSPGAPRFRPCALKRKCPGSITPAWIGPTPICAARCPPRQELGRLRLARGRGGYASPSAAVQFQRP